jgi:hypothetical protein
LAEVNKDNSSDAPQAASVGIDRPKVMGAEAKPQDEMIMRVIAGPETAEKLGVPVGTVVEARHVATPKDGSGSVHSFITPAEALRMHNALGFIDPPDGRLRRFVWRLRRRDFTTPHILTPED